MNKGNLIPKNDMSWDNHVNTGYHDPDENNPEDHMNINKYLSYQYITKDKILF